MTVQLFTETQYQFTAKIKNLGNNKNNTGWSITFDWKMPDSQYEFVLGGNKWDDIQGFAVNDVPDIIVNRGSQKGGDGAKSYDFWWNLGSITEGTGQPTQPPTATPGIMGTNGWNLTNAAPTPQSGDTLGQRIAWNSSINNAVTLFSHSEIRKDDWLDVLDYEKIKHIAGRVYNMIIAGPPQEEAEPAYPDATEMGSGGPEMAIEAVSPSQPQRTTAPPPTRPQRPPPKSSEAKITQLNQARHDKDGNEVYSGDDVVSHIATNYAERGPRDLVDAEIDAVIEALIAGQVKAAKVANDTAIF
jgi:hypothetical protein